MLDVRCYIRGDAVFQDLSIYTETFRDARVGLSSAGSKLNVTLSTANNIRLTGQIDTAACGYPFTAQASFNNYPLERIAGLGGLNPRNLPAANERILPATSVGPSLSPAKWQLVIQDADEAMVAIVSATLRKKAAELSKPAR